MSNNKQEYIRPVKCYFCGERMFYRGEEGFEPEMHVRIDTDLDDVPVNSFYAHVRCWNKIVERSP